MPVTGEENGLCRMHCEIKIARQLGVDVGYVQRIAAEMAARLGNVLYLAGCKSLTILMVECCIALPMLVETGSAQMRRVPRKMVKRCRWQSIWRQHSESEC